jgi:DNA-directed RNA polymerase subunit N (RpoN/RPB10)
MIIPIRCMTCNKVIANKYKLYLRLLEKELEKDRRAAGAAGAAVVEDSNIIDDIDDFDPLNTPQKRIFDRLNITRYCCKRHFISQVDLIDKI